MASSIMKFVSRHPFVSSVNVGSGMLRTMPSSVAFVPKKVFHNLKPAELYENALLHEQGTMVADSGALVASSGDKTGRCPRDKRVMRDAASERDIWWAKRIGSSSPNHEMDEPAFLNNRNKAISYLNSLDHVYVVDGYANWESSSRIKVRVVTEQAYHALFMRNMLIRPSDAELQHFGDPDFVIYNAGNLSANPNDPYMTSKTSVNMSFKHNELIILGTKYAGEMKKGVFSYMHYIMPNQGVLSLHSGCNVGNDGDVTLFFGLSGTGKTTLSTDPKRPLIGDDEHCWGNKGVFNIEGGCYAKCINLNKESEPEIMNAIKFGTVLENVDVDPDTGAVDFNSSRFTENTRASYPIEYIDNANIPCVAGHPTNIILLCCDAFGVLPPVSKLTLEQAMYHFVNGYTSKVAGTEVGVTEPQITFSACYGGAFLMHHPLRYASMLANKIAAHGTNVWLVNTGWTGGSATEGGARINLRYTRAIIDAIHANELTSFHRPSDVFGLLVPKACPGVLSDILAPQNTWKDQVRYDVTLKKLASLFDANHKTYMADVAGYDPKLVKMINSGGPTETA